MVSVKDLLTVVLVPSLLSAKTGSNGTGQSCLNSTAVDVTKVKTEFSGSVNKSGDTHGPEDAWFEDGGISGCPCNFERCLPLCCNLRYAKIADFCVADALTFTEKHQATYMENDRLFVDDHDCNSTFKSETLIEQNYKLFEDGSIYLTDLEQKVDLGRYCLFREADSPKYLAKACFDSKLTALSIWLLVSTNICALFLLATFIVYTVIPELKNLHGRMFRCYLASYISCVSLITPPILVAKISLEPIVYSYINILGIYYSGLASMMWMNAMSFDIWRRFRGTQFRRNVDIKKRQTTRFVCYSIYAWGGSAVPPLIHYCRMIFRPTKDNDSSLRSIVQYLMYSPIIGIVICNTCLYISTAITIRRRRKDMGNLVDGVNKHHQKENEQWFNLYYKLFLIMGGPQLLWAIAVYLKSRLFWQFVCTLEALQGVFTFLIFVWKDDVKRSVKKRSDEMVRAMAAYLRRDSMIAIEN